MAMNKSIQLFCLSMVLAQPAYSLDLLETYQLALANDPELKSTGFSKLSSSEIKSQSIAQMLPTISFNASGSLNDLQSTSFLGTRVQRYNENRLGLQLRQPLFHWEHWVQLDQADNKIAQVEAQFQAKQQALIRRSCEAYFNILAAQDMLAFAHAEKKAIENQLEQAKQRFEVGIIAITDVYEAQAGYDRAVATVIEAENQVDNSKEALREIIGDHTAEVMPLQSLIPLDPPTPNTLSNWTDSAENNNFSIVAQVNQAEFLRKSVAIQQAKHLPTLDVVAQYGAQDSGNLYGYTGDNQNVSLQLNLPLFEGGATRSRVRQADYDFQAAKEDLTKTKRTVTRLVKDAFRGVVASISRVQALDATQQSAAKAVEAAEAGFEVGTRTMVDVLTEQRNLYKAKSDFARSRYDYLINGIRLKEAAGSLSQADIADINPLLQRP